MDVVKKILPWALTLLFLTGCATFPPPEISNGRYINHKYAFNIEVPEGWHQTEKIPAWLKDILTEDDRSLIRIMFFNNETNGLIYLSSYKTIYPLYLIDCTSESREKKLRDVLEKRKKKLLKDPYVKSYSYKIYNIKNWTEKSSYETEFNKIEGRAKYIIYECHEDDTCILNIVLISDIKTFDKNYEVFNNVVDSFNKVKCIPKNKKIT